MSLKQYFLYQFLNNLPEELDSSQSARIGCEVLLIRLVLSSKNWVSSFSSFSFFVPHIGVCFSLLRLMVQKQKES